MLPQRSIDYNNSIRTRYSLDVIMKVLNAEDVISADINNNNNNTRISGNIISKEINFIICNMCFWCASLYSNANSSFNVKCPACDDNRNLESIPISKNESFKINYNSKMGVVLEFSR